MTDNDQPDIDGVLSSARPVTVADHGWSDTAAYAQVLETLDTVELTSPRQPHSEQGDSGLLGMGPAPVWRRAGPRAALAAAVAVVVVSGTVFVFAHPSGPVSIGPATTPSATTSPVTTSSAVAGAPPSTVTVAGGVATTPQLLSSILTGLLPTSGTVLARDGRTSHHLTITDLVWDDGGGPVHMTLAVGDGQSSGLTAPCENTTTSTCTVTADNSRIVVTKTFAYPQRQQHGSTYWSVNFTRPDGFTIDLSEANTTQLGDTIAGAVPPRPEPPLTTEQLTTIATNPAFAATVAPAAVAAAADLFTPS